MARYEHAGRFWTITVVGATVTITYGKLGNKGRTVVKHHATEAAALSAHDQLVLETSREGFRLVDEPAAVIAAPVEVPADDERGPALEAAIAENPDDANAFEVYGDWLQRHGDPRGELIALQHAASSAKVRPGTKSPAAVAVGKHLAQHAAHYLGPLAPLVPDVREPEGPPFFWKHGFIRRAQLAPTKGRALAVTVEQLLEHPSAKFLVELAVRAEDRKDALAILELLKRAAPPTLRELDFFARGNLDRIEGAIWRELDKLERLAVAARAYELVELHAPALRRAKFVATSMSSASIRAIVAAPWPVLERLEIRFCARNGSTEADFHDLRPLLFRTDMPALKALKLRGAPFAGAVARALIGSPFAQQLEVLDFSSGNFTPQDIATLGAAKFPNLKELWMPFERLNAQTMPQLANVAKHVIPDSRGPVDTIDFDLAGETVPRGDDRYGGVRE